MLFLISIDSDKASICCMFILYLTIFFLSNSSTFDAIRNRYIFQKSKDAESYDIQYNNSSLICTNRLASTLCVYFIFQKLNICTTTLRFAPLLLMPKESIFARCKYFEIVIVPANNLHVNRKWDTGL